MSTSTTRYQRSQDRFIALADECGTAIEATEVHKHIAVWSTTGFWIDASAPYEIPSKSVLVSSQPYQSNDSPGEALAQNSFTSVEVNDKFADYFMYKSSKGNSIPVTLGMLAWHVKMAAVLSGKPPMYTVRANPDYTSDPQVFDGDALPIWTQTNNANLRDPRSQGCH